MMATQEKDHLVVRYWPLIAMFIGGMVGFGTLQARVTELADGAKTASSDHDLLTKVSTVQEIQQLQLDRIERKVDKILPGDMGAANR